MFLLTLESEHHKGHCHRADADEHLEHGLADLAAGKTEALEAVYRLTDKSVYAFALSLLKNTHDAEDVMHDTYLHVASAAGSYTSSGKPMAWILTITRNLCMSKLRERSRRGDPGEDWEEALRDNTALDPESLLILRECLATLSDTERQILVLHAVSGFRHREIAAMLSLPLGTVLAKYNRTAKKLKKLLEGEFES